MMGAVGQEIAVALIVGAAALWIGFRTFGRARKGKNSCASCTVKGSGKTACQGCAAMKGKSKGGCPGCG